MINYSIKDISQLTGLSPSTLRYYETEQLIPGIERDTNGVRIYTDDDVEWILFIKALRATNMPINDIKKYVALYNQGNSTIQERKELIEMHQTRVHSEIVEQQKYLKLLRRKLKYYDVLERRINRRSSGNRN